MYLVTVEDDEGIWFDDPEGFDTLEEAQRFAGRKKPPAGYSAEVYECRLLQRCPQDSAISETTHPSKEK